MTADLVAFLNARYDEVEARLPVALGMTDDELHAACSECSWCVLVPVRAMAFGPTAEMRWDVCQRHRGPNARDRRDAADVAAKRQIVEMHQPDREHDDSWYWLERICKGCGRRWHKWIPDSRPTDIGPEQGCPTLRALASVYADHPDYQEDWRP